VVFDGVQVVYGKVKEELLMCKWGLFCELQCCNVSDL